MILGYVVSSREIDTLLEIAWDGGLYCRIRKNPQDGNPSIYCILPSKEGEIQLCLCEQEEGPFAGDYVCNPFISSSPSADLRDCFDRFMASLSKKLRPVE